PPERMRRVEASVGDGESLTYNPPLRAKVARGIVETLRLLASAASAMLLAAVLSTMLVLLNSVGLWLTWLFSGFVLIGAGIIAVTITIVVKWVCVGKHTAANHPLWSAFVWLNELQDAFVETVAAPWFFNHCMGTAELNTSLRSLGVKIGRGAWIESYWFTETDLYFIGSGSTVCTCHAVQTHLFQDRVMSLDTVTIDEGATLAAHSVALPASRIHAGATVAPGSLVMRGDQVPGHTVWQGNPIEPVG